MAFPAFPTDRLYKFITVLGVVIAAWAFHSQAALVREVRDHAAALTVEAVGVLEDARTLQERAVAAESLHSRELRPSCDDVSQLRRRAAILTAKGDTAPPADWPLFAVYLGLMLAGQGLAFLGAWAWYVAEHPPRPPTIIEP